MAADHERQTHQKQGNGESTRTESLNSTVVGIKRASWAKQSRELKENPWRFPSVSSDTDIKKNASEDITDPEQSIEYIDDDGAASENINGSNFKKHRCQFFLKVSMNIDSMDDIDGVCEEGDTECLQAVQFLQTVPAETRSMVAKYLSSGNPEHLTIDRENLHHIFHLAKMLNLLQLYNQCMKFCMSENSDEVEALFDSCDCVQDIIRESKTGYQRFISIVASKDDDTSPEFYIVVSDDGTEPNGKRTVIVIDMARKVEIFQRNIQNMYQLGNGSDCCCCYKKESPYIFACGGEGKYAQMCWKYDVLLGRWNKCAKMPQVRSKHKLLSSENGSIFVIGGVKTPSIDEYSISSNKWKTRASLEKHVHSPVCAMYNGKIYIFGGKTTAGPVATVQCYDTVTHNVNCLPDLPCEFADGKAVTFEDKIYIATEKGHMVCFVPETGESYLCAQQPVQRNNFGMFQKNDRIYLVGGVARGDDEGPVDTLLYRFNPQKDTWTSEPNLCSSFPAYSSCIIRYPKYCPVVPFSDKL